MLIGILLAALAACSPQYEWRKPGSTQADFRRDAYECERDMRQSGYFGSGLAAAFEAQAFQERCMEAKGYYKAPLSSSAADAETIVSCDMPGLGVMSTTPSRCSGGGGTRRY
jgi:hypothetical protein